MRGHKNADYSLVYATAATAEELYFKLFGLPVVGRRWKWNVHAWWSAPAPSRRLSSSFMT